MEIVKDSLDFTSFHLSASEKLFAKEKFIQNGKSSAYQKTSKYNLSLNLDYTSFSLSQTKLQKGGYESLKTLKWATLNTDLAKKVSEQIDELYKDDPELAKKYLILMEFLEENNPEAAEKLATKMEKALKVKNNHLKAMNHIENSIKNIADKIQKANAKDLQSIAERTHIKIDLKLEIMQKEKTVSKENEKIVTTSTMRSMKLRMAIDIQVTHTAHKADPLIVDLDGDGFDLLPLKDGVMFDINGDGKKELTSWITGDDAFLALDRNLNGKIDSGKELFGDQNGALNGFLELSKLDWDKNGILNLKDPMFKKLLLFRDLNRDGKSEKGELTPLYKAGIESINLNYLKFHLFLKNSALTSLSYYQRENGEKGQIGDFDLSFI